jgi:two-component system, LytTR family, response regulator
MYNIGIVDDEKHARETLKTMLARIAPGANILFEAQSPAEAIEMLGKYEIDILFLDIHLKNGNGFQILEMLPERKFQVIFVTAYNQYAIDAFRFAALHYILKPVSMNDLNECMQRVAGVKGQTAFQSEQISTLKGYYTESEPRVKKICIHYGNEMLFLKLSDIIRLEASSNYTWFILKSNKYLVSKTLKEYEDLLCKNGFIRVHQSHIINPEFMVKYQKSGGGEIVMTDDAVIPIARNRKNDFLRLIKL